MHSMSSTPNDTAKLGRAEQAFRDAFARLKANQPVRLAKGTVLSQNNVAKEAGCDPSALKKARYPALIAEIQCWLHDHPAVPGTSQAKTIASQRNKNSGQKARIDEVVAQRDHAMSLLVEADAKILELVQENARLRTMLPHSNVVDLPLQGSRKQTELRFPADGLD